MIKIYDIISQAVNKKYIQGLNNKVIANKNIKAHKITIV